MRIGGPHSIAVWTRITPKAKSSSLRCFPLSGLFPNNPLGVEETRGVGGDKLVGRVWAMRALCTIAVAWALLSSAHAQYGQHSHTIDKGGKNDKVSDGDAGHNNKNSNDDSADGDSDAVSAPTEVLAYVGVGAGLPANYIAPPIPTPAPTPGPQPTWIPTVAPLLSPPAVVVEPREDFGSDLDSDGSLDTAPPGNEQVRCLAKFQLPT